MGVELSDRHARVHVVLAVQNLGVPKDRRVWREATTLAGAGYRVTVVAPAGRGERRRERLQGVDICRYWGGPQLPGALGQVVEVLVGLCGVLVELARLRARGPVTVLHTANPPDTTVVAAALLRRTGGTRYVYDQHDLCPELMHLRAAEASGSTAWALRLLTPAVRAFEAWSYRAADLVVTPNNSYRCIATSRGGVPADAAVTVRSGADEVRLRLGGPARTDGLRVAYAGVMGRQDRVDVLLEAAALLQARRPGAVHVDLIGDGDDVPHLRLLADRLQLDGSVTWAGWLTGEALTARLALADVGVSLDDDNPFCQLSTMSKVPEYLALGLPCVLADLHENRETAGAAAAYFEPGSAIELSKRLEELVDDPALCQQLAENAAARAPSIVWSASADRLLAAYEWLLHDGPPVEGDQVLPE